MRAYGLPRNFCVEYPDVADALFYGLKSSATRLRTKGGDYPPTHKTRAKRLRRIFWKRQARTEARREISKALCEEM